MAAFIVLFIVTLAFAIIPIWFTQHKPIWLNVLLSFSGAFLLGITLLHIIPELYGLEKFSLSIGIFVMVGFFIQVILESYSKGIEHGHVHIHDFGKLPLGLYVALTLHALLEGSALDQLSAGHSHVVFAILFHKIPVAFLLGVLLFSLKLSRGLTILLLSLFALATPLGSYVASMLNYTLFNVPIRYTLMAMATGSFLHVSTTILFENSPDHKLKINKFIPALLGGTLAIISVLLTH